MAQNGKLHEILAVEGDLEGISKKLTEETLKTFGKSDHFIGQTRTLQMFDATAHALAPEIKELVTTVPEKLDYLSETIVRYFDVVLQKELTNQTAIADLVVDGAILATSLPATFLLGLENKLKAVRQVYDAAPTLAPGVAWDEDKSLGKGVYRQRHAEEVFKTAKTYQHKVLYDAVDKHPAQIEKWEETVPIGKYVTTKTCGMLTPATKSAYLGRIDKLIQGVKAARMRANCVPVVSATVGKELFKYIHGE